MLCNYRTLLTIQVRGAQKRLRINSSRCQCLFGADVGGLTDWMFGSSQLRPKTKASVQEEIGMKHKKETHLERAEQVTLLERFRVSMLQRVDHEGLKQFLI